MIPEEQLFLVPKQTKEDKLRFKIPTGLSKKSMFADGYCTWEELLNVKGPLPTDIIDGLSWDDEEYEENSGYTLILVVCRTREETDEEYLNRLKSEEDLEKMREENEWNQYKRLKAKYEAD
jgi:hypothetical protein